MKRSDVLIINPNTSERTTAMMVAVARRHVPAHVGVEGATASFGAGMIVDEAALASSASEVVRIGLTLGPQAGAVVVAAFGDPGAKALRERLSVPVIGIGEAALCEAAAGGRRFGIATTTPGLVGAIRAMVAAHGLAAQFTGIRVPEAEPLALASDPHRQDAALGQAVRECLQRDGANAVVIGGGPLSDTAARLHAQFPTAIIEPLPAAMRALPRGFFEEDASR